MDEKLVNSMLAADLRRTFAAIDQKYGSPDKFLETEMDLTPANKAVLKYKYLD